MNFVFDYTFSYYYYNSFNKLRFCRFIAKMPPSGKVFVKPGSLAQKKKSSEIQRDKQSEKKTGKTGLVQKKNTYEIQREKQIEKNTEIMQSLGIHVK